MSILALAAMDKLIRKSGAKRVSEDAKEAMRALLEETGEKIARKSVEFAKHGGRTTVKAVDIKLAMKS